MRKILFLLFFPISLAAQKNYTALLDSFMKGQAKYYNFNGNVLVAQSGKIIYQKAFGYRKYYTQEKLNDNSVFELASVSKQFTAMGILLLKEKGKLQLTDSLRKFFPELPYNNITVRHLLNHTSGLPDYEELMMKQWDQHKIAYNNDVIKFLAEKKPSVKFSPGAKWSYSNTGYMLLASIIEKVSGKSFKDYMHENIFKPLGMTQTRVYNTRRSQKETIPNYAYGHVFSDSMNKYMLPDSIRQLNFVYYMDGIQGDGIVNSTTGDLLKWDRALKNGTLLSAATQNEMLSAQAITDSTTKAAYGYGIMVTSGKFGNELSHSGGWPGYVTSLSRNIDKDITFIVLSNNSSRSPIISNTLRHIMFDEPVVFPYEHKEVKIDSKILEKYTGKYIGPPSLELISKEGKLYVKGKASDTEVKPESETKFFYGDKSDRQIEFVVDKSGAVTNVWLIAFGIKTPLKKNIIFAPSR